MAPMSRPSSMHGRRVAAERSSRGRKLRSAKVQKCSGGDLSVPSAAFRVFSVFVDNWRCFGLLAASVGTSPASVASRRWWWGRGAKFFHGFSHARTWNCDRDGSRRCRSLPFSVESVNRCDAGTRRVNDQGAGIHQLRYSGGIVRAVCSHGDLYRVELRPNGDEALVHGTRSTRESPRWGAASL